MTRQERIESFGELIMHTNNVPMWIYDSDYKLEYTSYPREDYIGLDTLFQSQVADKLKSARFPIRTCFIYSFLNLLWVLDFEEKDGRIDRIYAIGPTFTTYNSFNELKNKMDERGLSIQIKALVSRNIRMLSVISRTIMSNYAKQLHYLIHGDNISVGDIHLFGEEEELSDEVDFRSNTHYGIWASEQEFLKLFSEGNPRYKDAITKSSSLSDGVKHTAKDTLRYSKNNFLVLLTLLSRAAIEGGVSPDLSYDLCDYYANASEACTTIAEHNILISEMPEVYFEHVVKAKQNLGISKFIQNSCDYISAHTNEKISISELAEKAGYSEYYFSRKFKNEVGCSVNEYITRKKIEKARILLESTNTSILDISLELSFNSRSYFSDTFQKIVGMSPGEYRKQNAKI